MVEVRETETFSRWLGSLRDLQGKVKIARRISRLAKGNIGDARPVGDGVSELRVHFGPGYRVYFVQRGKQLILLLAGGDKSTQERDIKAAKQLAKTLKD